MGSALLGIRLGNLQALLGAALRRKQFIDTVFLASAAYICLPIDFLHSIFLARWLGPAQYGVWLSLVLIVTYGQHMHAGMINAVYREIPLAKGQKNDARAMTTAHLAAGFLTAVSLLWLCAGGAVIAYLYPGQLVFASGFLIIALLSVWQLYCETLLKSETHFRTVSALRLTQSGLNILLLPLVFWFGLAAACWKYFTVVLLMLTAGFRLARPLFAIRCAFSVSGWRQLLRVGIPLWSVSLIFALQISADRLLVALLYGTSSLGVYGVAVMLLTAAMALPGVIGQTSYPYMLRLFGEAGRAEVLRAGIVRQTLLLLAVSTCFAAGLALLLPFFVRLALPQYVPGIRAALALLPGIVFLAASVPSSYFLQTIRRQDVHLLISASALVLQAGAVMLAHDLGHYLVAVAAVTSLAFICYSAALFSSFVRLSRPEA